MTKRPYKMMEIMDDPKESLPSVEGDSEPMKVDEIESSSTLTFSPPVYVQRYLSVKNILNEEWSRRFVRKAVDFGCAEFKLFKYLKELSHIEHICGVDVEDNLISRCKYEARPLSFHYILGFPHKLIVDLFVGSIAEPDKRLLNVDAVICIELIEHLYPDVLEKVPSTVFEYIKPNLAIFTTPNADFNVLFNLEKFRHDDHKFEWSRKEFEDWCSEILRKYPNYEVEYKGIGDGPKGTEHLGSCSQMAIFRKITPDVETEKAEIGEPYTLHESFEYPYKPDFRTIEEKFSDDLTYRLNRIFTNKTFMNEYEDLKFEIPVDYLWEFLKEFCPQMETFLNILREKGYTIIEKDNEYILEIFQEEHYSDSDDELSCGNLCLNNKASNSRIATEVDEEAWDNF